MFWIFRVVPASTSMNKDALPKRFFHITSSTAMLPVSSDNSTCVRTTCTSKIYKKKNIKKVVLIYVTVINLFTDINVELCK